jgi:hypothetical protein
MQHLHPNLGQNAWGRRKTVYLIASAITLLCGIVGFFGVGFGIVPGHPTDLWISWIIFFILWLPFIALIDNPGETRTRVESWSEFAFVWLLVSGLSQTFWELPWFFLDMAGLVHNITEEDNWLWIWWAYGGADTRYITSNPTIAGLEFAAGLSGPVEIWAWWTYVSAKTMKQKLTACWAALIIGCGLTYFTVAFFVAEWHVDWVNIKQGATGFWLKFVGLNLPWIVAPIFSIPAALYELAHWYRLEGYKAALEKHGITE